MAVRELSLTASSHVSGASYNDETQELVVNFGSSTYSYEGVPAEVADGLAAAKSAGSYLHANIKGQYATKKL